MGPLLRMWEKQQQVAQVFVLMGETQMKLLALTRPGCYGRMGSIRSLER